jgi:hypothetical protein
MSKYGSCFPVEHIDGLEAGDNPGIFLYLDQYIDVVLRVRVFKGIALSFHWVKGHADRIDGPLTRDERLNIEADMQADVI